MPPYLFPTPEKHKRRDVQNPERFGERRRRRGGVGQQARERGVADKVPRQS